MNPDIPVYYSIIFILLVFAVLFFIVRGVNFGLSRHDVPDVKRQKITIRLSLSLFTWLIISEMLAFAGFFKDYSVQPPLVVFLYLPPIALIISLLYNRKFEKLLLQLPPSWLVNAQSIRVVIDLIFLGLFLNNIISKRMTFLGSNYDILIGLLAPLISYYCFRRRLTKYYAVIWNLLGLLFHLTFITTLFYSMPGSTRLFFDGPANTLYGYFPFVWMPAFTSPFIIAMHLFSMKQLLKTKILL